MAADEAEALFGHPLQYAYVGRTYVADSNGYTDDEVRQIAGHEGAIGLPVERYNRCPTCEQWSPCKVRKGRK